MTKAPDAADDPRNLCEVLDAIAESADGEQISLQDVLNSFHHRSFGPVLVSLSILMILPTGAIPGVPFVLGLIIIVFAVQLLVGLKHPWLPQRLLDLTFSRSAFKKGQSYLHRPAKVIDKFLHRRWSWLAKGIGSRLIAVAAIGLSLLTLPLEIIPYAVVIPGLALLAYGLGLTARDGLVVALGHGFAAGAAALVMNLT